MVPFLTRRMQRVAANVLLVAAVVMLCSCVSSKIAAVNSVADKVSGLNFSAQLSSYPMQATARSRTVDQIYDRTATPGITLAPELVDKRKEIIRMYQAAGIDISLDRDELRKLKPTDWSRQTPQPLNGLYLQPYSIDSPFYHKIPTSWPRVELPTGYIQSGHISTLGAEGDGSDGFGIGVVISNATDPIRNLSLANGKYVKTGACPEHNSFTGYNTTIHLRNSANKLLGGSGEGVPYQSSDRTVVWLDSSNQTIVATWITSPDCDRPDLKTKLGDWSGEAIAPKETLPNLGDQGGINAAAKSDLVALIRPGESIDPAKPIFHALAGPVKNAWKAIVYPASSTDRSIDQNNRGLLGYGFLVQLDPKLDLAAMKLSLPARRILEAIQSYGWYMDDTGVRDFDIKGNFSAAEFALYGGVDAVDAEILAVVKTQKLYVVPPLVKK